MSIPLPSAQCKDVGTAAALRAAITGIATCLPDATEVQTLANSVTACSSFYTIFLTWIAVVWKALCYLGAQIVSILDNLVTIQEEIDAIQNNMRTPGAVNITAGPASGGGSAVTVTGNDTAGQISLTTGPSGQTTGVTFTLLFPTAYTTAGTLVLLANNLNAQGLLLSAIAPASTTTVSQSEVSQDSTPLAADTTYIWNYYVAGGT